MLLSSRGLLSVRRAEGTIRFLFHRGGHSFLPSGAPSVEIHFTLEDGRAEKLSIRNPKLIVEAVRVAA